MNEKCKQYGRYCGEGYGRGRRREEGYPRKVFCKEGRAGLDADGWTGHQAGGQDPEDAGQGGNYLSYRSETGTVVLPHHSHGQVIKVVNSPYRKLKVPRTVPTDYVGFSFYGHEKNIVDAALIHVAVHEEMHGNRWREDALLRMCEIILEEMGMSDE